MNTYKLSMAAMTAFMIFFAVSGTIGAIQGEHKLVPALIAFFFSIGAIRSARRVFKKSDEAVAIFNEANKGTTKTISIGVALTTLASFALYYLVGIDTRHIGVAIAWSLPSIIILSFTIWAMVRVMRRMKALKNQVRSKGD